MAYNPGGSKRGSGDPRFGGGGHGGGGRSFGGGRDRGRDNRGPKQMHEATCAECGRTCEVPFRPTGEKPVFCRDCFNAKEGDSRGSRRDDRRDNRRDDRRDYSDRREMHQVVCTDCGTTCEVPFKPSSDKPIYCDSCFSKHKEEGFKKDRKNDIPKPPSKLEEKVEIMNIKLDRILKALNLAIPVKESKEIKIPEEIIEPVKTSEIKSISVVKKAKKTKAGKKVSKKK